MKGRVAVITFICLLLMVIRSSADESITLTTYFPAPSGEYEVVKVRKLAVGPSLDPLSLSDGQLEVEDDAMVRGDFTVVRNLRVGNTTSIGGAGTAFGTLAVLNCAGHYYAIDAYAGDYGEAAINATGGDRTRWVINATVANATQNTQTAINAIGGYRGVFCEGNTYGVYAHVRDEMYGGQSGGVAVYARPWAGLAGVYADASGMGGSGQPGADYAGYFKGGFQKVLMVDGNDESEVGIRVDNIKYTGTAENSGIYVKSTPGIKVMARDKGLTVVVNSTSTAAYFSGRVEVSGNVEVSGTVTASGSDVAEYFFTTEPCEVGDVLVIDKNTDKRLTKSAHPYEQGVVGVVCRNPGLVLGEKEKGKRLVSLLGQVKCKATTENGAISPGDLLVTSSTPGYVMRGDIDKIKPGMVVGKALERLEEEKGEILILVGAR